ncbi:MAG TPA: chemotaxis protein, partial [Cyanobacteria bacterium UBA8553]|nr:chemotaxis protein [Cyanobacteria bacterium UBA8553]
MTQISPNSGSHNMNNNRGSSSKSVEVEGQTSATHYSSPALLPYPKTAITLRKSDEIEHKASTKSSAVQLLQVRQWLFNSLRTKATALAIGLGTIPVLLTGGTAYYVANQQISQQISDVKVERAIGVEDKVKRFMRERYSDIIVLATRSIFTNPTTAKNTPVEEKLEQLERFIDSSKTYDSIAMFDLNGNVLLQTKGDPLPNHSDRVYFQEVIKTNQPVISNPELSKSSGKFVVHIAAPIKDKSTGKMIAVIQTRMPVEKLDELIANFGNKGDEFYLIDTADGEIFLASEKTKESKKPSEVYSNFAKLQADNKPSARVLTDQTDKQDDLVSYARFGPLEGLPTLKWEAVIGTPTDIAFAPQQQLLLLLAIGSLVTAALVSAIAAYIANRVTRP